MNIILSTHTLRYPLTGIGKYTQNLLNGLRKNQSINQIFCIPNILNNSSEITSKNISISKLKKTLKVLPGLYSCYNYLNDFFYKKKTQNLLGENFIYHEPCYILRPYSGLKICTIHDLSHIKYPEYHPRERVNFLSRYLPNSVLRADHIITVSKFIRNEIIHLLNVAPEKVTCIYHGISKLFKIRANDEVKSVLANYNLNNKSYLLSVGTLEPRKNLERLIQAFKQLPEQQRNKYPLVLVGIKGWNTSRFEKLARSLIKKQQLYCLGYVPEVYLPYLYSGAYGFIYISIYEGFGLPLLEAMASGIPTLASSESAMPEVVGNSAMIVNPFDIDLITDKLNQLINDLTLRERLKHEGPIQAAKFSWDSCIENTIEIYRRTLKSSGIG